MVETLEDWDARYVAWKTSMEGKGLRVNLAKTKVLISDKDRGPSFTPGKYPCGVFRKGVGVNLIYCIYCTKWVHKRCSGVSGRLDAVADFRCRTCLRSEIVNEDSKKVEIDGVAYHKVDQFCYLDDMLSAGGGAEASSIARIKSGWKKFWELLPILTRHDRSLKAKGIPYTACVGSVMTYGSEAWTLKEEDIWRISRTDMQMIRWMCQVTLRDRKSSEELRDTWYYQHSCNVASEKAEILWTC